MQSDNGQSLAGKTAVITGGSRGIGLAIAKKLAASGAELMILGSNPKNLADAKDSINGTVASHAADLRTLAGCEGAFDAYRTLYSRCDIFVHSAGATKGGVYHFDFYRLKSIDEAMDIGTEEYLESENLCLIEWGERISPLLPRHTKVTISINEDQSRTLNIVNT